MNIIVTISSLLPESGGTSRVSTQLCSALAPLGVNIELLSLDYGRQQGAPLLPPADLVKTRLLPCHYSRRLRLLWAPQYKRALTAEARALRGGLIHDNGVWQTTNHVAAQVARQCNVPLIISPHGMLEPWALCYKSWKKRPAWRFYQKRDLQTARLLHATSAMEARSLRELGLRQPIAIVPHGVDLPPLAKAPPQSGGLRTALFLSRIHPKKGLLNLVSAWNQLRPAGWRVVIAGPDEDGHGTAVRAAVRAAGLDEVFTFTGPVEGNGKWELYHRADLFVLPTFSENFGVVVAEALGCGVPVITTTATPWGELRSQQCGWWVEPGREPLTEALRSAMALSDAERRAMGERGRRLVTERYSWAKIAAEMRAVYQWVLGNASKPACLEECS